MKSASDKPVRLKVQPDREAVQTAIVAFVGNYNKLMAQINILTRNDEKVISEITYFTDDEKKTAKERLGSLQGDSTLNLLSGSLQRVAIDAYPTKDGQDMTLLSQLGIALNASRPGTGGYDVSKMRGYLEIEDETLAKALDEHFEAAKQLFGNDTNGDLIVDCGIRLCDGQPASSPTSRPGASYRSRRAPSTRSSASEKRHSRQPRRQTGVQGAGPQAEVRRHGVEPQQDGERLQLHRQLLEAELGPIARSRKD